MAALQASSAMGEEFKFPVVYLEPVSRQHPRKKLELLEKIAIGRTTTAKTKPAEGNGWYDSKVLSRAHAEIWAEGGKVLVRDCGSSNGTYLNNQRLSDEGQQSEPFELTDDDNLTFGIDIMDDNTNEVLYAKVSNSVKIVLSSFDGPESSGSNGTAASQNERVVKDIVNHVWDTVSSNQSQKSAPASTPSSSTPAATTTESKKIEDLMNLLKKELNQSAQSATDMQHVLTSVNEINDMFSLPKDAGVAIESLEKERDDLKEKIKVLEKNSAANDKSAQLESELKETKKKYELQIQQLESRIASLSSEVAAVTASRTAAEKSAAQLAQQLETVKKEKAALEAKELAQNSNNPAAIIAENKKAIESLQSQVEEYQSKLQAANTKIDSVTGEAQRWRTLAEEAESRAQTAAESAQKITVLEQEIKALKEELGRARHRGRGLFGWLAWTLGWN